VLQYMRVTNEILKRAQVAQQEKTATANAIAELAPVAVDALIANERLLPHQRDEVIKAASQPPQALALLRDLAPHRTDRELEKIGHEVGDSKGGQIKRSTTVGRPVADFDTTPGGQQFRQRLLQGAGAS